MAGALRRTRMPDGSISADHEGVGTADARWSNRLLDNGELRRLPDRRHERLDASSRTSRSSVASACAWRWRGAVTPRAASNTAKSDTLTADLDLRVTGRRMARRCGRAHLRQRERDGRHHRRLDRHDAHRGPRRRASTPPRSRTAWRGRRPAPSSMPTTRRSARDHLWPSPRASPAGAARLGSARTTSVSREQMAAFLRPRGRPPRPPPPTSSRMMKRRPFEASINRVAAAGIAGGCSPGRFCPTDP